MATLVLSALLAGAAGAAGAATPTNADLAEEVRRTETAFAKTMADRDHAAFASHLADETIFFGASGPLRGKEAVAAAWKRFYEAPAAPFSWRPDQAVVLPSGNLGYTSGPVFDPKGQRVGTFNSVWRREPDGRWRIVFDNGCPPCNCGAATAPAAPASPRPSPAP
jgi:ketosteroid isomerase-like protein